MDEAFEQALARRGGRREAPSRGNRVRIPSGSRRCERQTRPLHKPLGPMGKGPGKGERRRRWKWAVGGSASQKTCRPFFARPCAGGISCGQGIGSGGARGATGRFSKGDPPVWARISSGSFHTDAAKTGLQCRTWRCSPFAFPASGPPASRDPTALARREDARERTRHGR